MNTCLPACVPELASSAVTRAERINVLLPLMLGAVSKKRLPSFIEFRTVRGSVRSIHQADIPSSSIDTPFPLSLALSLSIALPILLPILLLLLLLLSSKCRSSGKHHPFCLALMECCAAACIRINMYVYMFRRG